MGQCQYVFVSGGIAVGINLVVSVKVVFRFNPPDLFLAVAVLPLIFPSYPSFVLFKDCTQQSKLIAFRPGPKPDFRRGADHDNLMAASQMPVDALNTLGPQNPRQMPLGIGCTQRPEPFRPPAGEKMSQDFLLGLPVVQKLECIGGKIRGEPASSEDHSGPAHGGGDEIGQGVFAGQGSVKIEQGQRGGGHNTTTKLGLFPSFPRRNVIPDYDPGPEHFDIGQSDKARMVFH